MLSRQEKISKLVADKDSRASYIRSKLNQLIPSQIRALRIKAEMSQKQLGEEADMKQSRISASESGMANFSLETLIRLAAAFKVGLQVRFVPYSEMLTWDNEFSQDRFSVKTITEDSEFLSLSNTPKKNAIIGIGATVPSGQVSQMNIGYTTRQWNAGSSIGNIGKSGGEYGQASA